MDETTEAVEVADLEFEVPEAVIEAAGRALVAYADADIYNDSAYAVAQVAVKATAPYIVAATLRQAGDRLWRDYGVAAPDALAHVCADLSQMADYASASPPEPVGTEPAEGSGLSR